MAVFWSGRAAPAAGWVRGGEAGRQGKAGGLEELQDDLDLWIEEYNEVRTHQGRWCYGKTPMQTFRDSIDLAREKMSAAERGTIRNNVLEAIVMDGKEPSHGYRQGPIGLSDISAPGTN